MYQIKMRRVTRIILFFLEVLVVQGYKPLSYKEIHSRFNELARTCPFLSLTTGQEEYNIEYPEDCDGCSHLIVKIGNLQSKTVPQLYFSGCLHGDERVGPVVLTELAEFLCSEYSKNTWIQSIVDNHLIVMTPTTNAQGYFKHRREEYRGKNIIDPNRDFPFDNKQKCGESITSQLIVHLFDSHLFRAGITFHGGESSLTYPWGAYLHYKNSKSTEAPDLQTFEKLSSALWKYSQAQIELGTMNDVVYPVHGSLEDWAYAGGFDTQGVSSCGVSNFSNPEGLKQVFFLLEADKSKNPIPSKYGTKEQVFQEAGGLIPQYIRMSLALVDLSEPYIKYFVKRTRQRLVLNWEVWGCIDVWETQVFHSVSNETDWKSWNSTSVKSGGGRWGNLTEFHEEFLTDRLFFVILAKVDKWDHQTRPDPDVVPQTHMFRVRNEDYQVHHNGFTIKGRLAVTTQVVDTDLLPNTQLRALFGSQLFEIFDYGEKFEVRSEFEIESLFVYRFGDSTQNNEKVEIIQELCGKNEKIMKKIFSGCKSPKVLAGRLLEVPGKGLAVLESSPPVEVSSFAQCFGVHQNLTIEKYDKDYLLITATGSFSTVSLEVFGYSLELSKGIKSKFLHLKDSKALGGSVKMVINGSLKDECIVRVSRELQHSYPYTHIKFPLWVVIIFISFKIVFVLVILYKKCLKKKPLKAPKYEEIQLVFTNPQP
jgi:hypothetical protein